MVLFCLSCANVENKNPIPEHKVNKTDSLFTQAKWNSKIGERYDHREFIVKDILYNDTIRKLNKNEIIKLLGNPNRINNNHYYYLISEKTVFFLTMSAKYLVFKFTDQDKIEWIKMHN